jgi:SPOR domain
MADRYDPKLSVHPLSERKPAPLADLARVFSGGSTLNPRPATRSKKVPVNGSVASDVALANDLESELLNNLQVSFSSTFYAPPPPPPAPPPVPPAAKPAAQATKPAAAPAPKPQPSAAAPAAAAAAPAASPTGEAKKRAAKSERPAVVVQPRPEKPASAPAVLPPRAERQAPAATPAERPPVVRHASVASEKAGKSELAEAQLRPTTAAHTAPAETAAAKPSGWWERPAEARAAAPEPSRFAPLPRGAALFRPKAPVPEPKPQGDELPDEAPSGVGATEEEAYDEATLALDLDTLALDDAHDGELPPLPGEFEQLGHRSLRRSLFIGGAALAVVLAAGAAYVMLWGESSVAKPPIVTADTAPAKIVPAGTPADNDEQNKSIDDRVAGAQSAEQTKLVTPGDDKAAAAPAASGRAAASGDHPAADAAPASDGDSGQVSPKKVRTLTVVNSGAPSSDDADKLPPGASAAVPPSAAPAADGAADAHPDLPAAAASSGGVFVQVAAQKSEVAAKSTYHDLQVKFPTILGEFSPNIQRADLGDRGIYYRVRVGPFALADAQKICGSYRAAGGYCLIAQH